MNVEIFGYIAAIASVSSFAPQAWKIIKTQDTSSVSKTMYVVTVIGFSLWILYGVGQLDWPIILTNSICLLFSAFILVMKVLPQRIKNAISMRIKSITGA